MDFLKHFMAQHRVNSTLFPYVGGLVGYLSYEFTSQLEPSFPSLRSPDFPEFEFGMYEDGIIFDHSSFRAYYFTTGERGEILELLDSLPSAEDVTIDAGRLRSNLPADRFEEAVVEAKGRIFAGEAFQIVLSRALSSPYSGDPLALYSDLRLSNPSPYMFYLDFDHRQVLGSSPETLVTVRGREATTFPIAGTRPLGVGSKGRRKMRDEMLLDEKERAEHCMLVDLARNDIGKVSEFGSVYVPEFMRVETFSHVQHIVSKVQGTLRPEVQPLDALAAVFPAGTVSGAPKPRAMEIIAELERFPRGPYAGGVGYLSFNGNLDSAITIRSAFVNGDNIRLQAGAGIVADSDPRREFEETEQKLGALVDALKRCSFRSKGEREAIA
jgi:anthranilate synthase component 1